MEQKLFRPAQLVRRDYLWRVGHVFDERFNVSARGVGQREFNPSIEPLAKKGDVENSSISEDHPCRFEASHAFETCGCREINPIGEICILDPAIALQLFQNMMVDRIEFEHLVPARLV